MISSPTLFLLLFSFLFCNLLHPFSAYGLHTGSAHYMGSCYGWCNSLFFTNLLILPLLSWIFILSPPFLLTSTHLDHLTNCTIQTLLLTIFCVYRVIFFMLLITFPMLLHVSPTNWFVQSLLQLSFSFACSLCFVTFYTHLVHMRYAMGLHIAWVPVMVDVNPYFVPI